MRRHALSVFLLNGKTFLWLLLAGVQLVHVGCLFFQGQRYHHFITKTPLPGKHLLILGFLGGRDSWEDPRPGVHRLALKLRSRNLAGVHIETVENKKRDLALQLIRNSFDQNRDGTLDTEEKAAVRLILYGQSFGGAAVVKLASELHPMNVPVLLTVQIDSVGREDAQIPPNVACAANLFQRDGVLIRGEPEIRPDHPSKTKIIGNFQYHYRDKRIDLSAVPWHKRIFRVAHAKMDLDPEVWSRVEELILDTMKSGCPKPGGSG